MNRKLFQLLTLVAFVCLSPSAWADGGGEFDCQVPGLIALNPGTPAGLALDFARAQASPLSATVTRDYDFPGSDVRVSIQMRYLGTRLEVSKTFFRKVGSSVQLMLTFVSPTSLDFPLIVGALYILKTGEPGGTIPPFEMNCQLTAAK